jgi:drug/metabolite transporter (DMT)-like permease
MPVDASQTQEPMPILFDLPYYVVYSLFGASSAALAKSSLRHALQRSYLRALLFFGAALCCLCCSLSLLLFLLHRTDMSIMVPTSVGLSLMVSSIISVVLLKEHIGLSKITGMVLIAIGVALLSAGR